MDEFLMSLQAQIDKEKSKGNINNDLNIIQKELDKLKVQAEIDKNSLSNIVKQLESALGRKINIPNISFDSKTGQQIGSNIAQNIADGVSKASDKVNAEVQKMADKINKLANGGINNDYATQISVLEGRFSRLGLQESEITQKTSGLTSSLEELRKKLTQPFDESNLNEIFSLNDKLQSELAESSNEATRLGSSIKMATDSSRLNNAKSWQTWANNNGKAMKKWGAEINDLIAKMGNLDIPMPKIESDALVRQMKEIQAEAIRTGNVGMTVGEKLKNAWEKFGGWSIATGSIMTLWHQLKQLPKTVYELDTALVDLRKTTSMSASELEDFYYDANKVAKQMGVSTKEIIDQASAWSRLGYSSAEAASKMAKYSSMFASISPGMDVDTATDGLVSIMKAFDIGNDNPDDVLDGIMSKINIIGNTAATSNTEIVNMLSKSSSAMKEANNTLEETIALETAAVEITRDDDSVGTAFKTISMRIRGYDEETQEYIGNIEELEGEIASLTKTASTPGGISLFTDASKTEYKSTYQLLKEISEIYDQLTDKNQAALLETLAGKRQGQIVAATINNFEAVEKALENMENSAGSAEREMSVIMDSLDYKLNRLGETSTSIAKNLFQRDDMKNTVDGLTAILGLVEKLTDKLGLFGTVSTLGGGILGANGLG
ncbi:MAG: phage tail tape measure protein [Ruminococcus flavefaciens]|nr:phage tail tape measure protein [Ruminococcus flavefaciens]